MLFLFLILVVGSARSTSAACPQNLDDCLGAAVGYGIVADRLLATRGIIFERGEGQSDFGASIGASCASQARMIGGYDCVTEVQGDLVVTAADGYAAVFSLTGCAPEGGSPGVRILGDLVTGGSLLKGPTVVQVNGMIDTSGTDPRVGTCAQALSDMHSASATLAALTPTRNLGAVRAEPLGEWSITLAADPGVNVWTASELTAPTRPRYPSHDPTQIVIALDPATESVIINVDKVFVDVRSAIYVSGDPDKVVLNVARTLRTKGDVIQPRILAADGRVLVKVSAYVRQAFASRFSIFGGYN